MRIGLLWCIAQLADLRQGKAQPWTAAWLFEVFTALSAGLGLQRPLPVPDATLLLFVNLLGSVVVVWSLWRWRHPSRQVGRYDALVRGLFAVWQVYAVTQGASLLLLGFTLMEVVFEVAQVWPVRRQTVVVNSERRDVAEN